MFVYQVLGTPTREEIKVHELKLHRV